MARILHIETATPVCSVSIAASGITQAVLTTSSGNDHMSVITGNILAVCEQAGIGLKDIDAVAVSSGPGSYTGLRIGASTAKGICHALNKPLIAVPTLLAMVSGIQEKYQEEALLFCPLMDARRMEVYTLVADRDCNISAPARAYVIEEPYFDFIPAGRKTVFFGSGVEKTLNFLPEGSISDLHYFPSAEHLHLLALRQFNRQIFADTAYFEPEYGKEFYTPAKKQ
ncbi:MAG TPA: tRNA (adenosine(37)-N6)-threonylcarbamoyltransferase complex dimerization subunit type 1 TsaB [Chitinophagales bacterium]|nr:tRNA (adenosine(37)-N6)-threonylcarbamoyltransferase complex dimerization subunit type 1 TsaB [Chitinophagales bacterium]HNM09670.1 tRNA (adenosine(37)-N6)-threonylcarbamoyltransferase complex dimerization subunit type 1 TsaB [Chitinophagales bacterium]